MMKSIYLCGPIDGRTDAECNNWRSMARQLFHGKCLDPMVRDARGKQHEVNIVRNVVEGDKADIITSDALLVYYFMPTVGTSMEIMFAFERGIPVVVVNASGKPDVELSYWIRYHADSIRPDLTSAVARLHFMLYGHANVIKANKDQQ